MHLRVCFARLECYPESAEGAVEIRGRGYCPVRAKKIKDATEKLGKAQAVLDKFRRKEKMTAADWKVVIAFVLSRYKANEPVSKCQTIGKIKDKLQELEKAKEVTWDSFVEDELGKSRATPRRREILQLMPPSWNSKIRMTMVIQVSWGIQKRYR